MKDLTVKNSCKTCQQPLSKDSPKGLCPTCLLNRAVGTPVESLYHYPRPDKALPLKQLSASFPELEITEFIGQGATGTVFKAYHSKSHESVALKVLSAQLSKDVEFAERFVREGKTLAALDHPNIVKVLDAGERDGQYYILMEHVDGPDLKDLIHGKQLSRLDAQSLIPQICDGVMYAHQQGVIHRDIKPANILVDEYGEIKIADFGLAKLTSSKELVSLTRTGQIMGTPHYMAPEQLENPDEVDHRADIYSMGVVFYELLTGELPLGRFPSLVELDVGTMELDELLLKLLEKRPEKRYQEIQELQADLEGPLKSLTTGVRLFKERKDSKTSRNAIVSILGVPLFAAVPIGLIMLLASDDGDFYSAHKILPICLILMGLAAPLLTISKGLQATKEILSAEGKLKGLYWATTASLAFPLLFLDLSLFYVAWPAFGTGHSLPILATTAFLSLLACDWFLISKAVGKARQGAMLWIKVPIFAFCLIYTPIVGYGGYKYLERLASGISEQRIDDGYEQLNPYSDIDNSMDAAMRRYKGFEAIDANDPRSPIRGMVGPGRK